MIQENVLRCGPIVPIGTSDVEASALWNDWGAVQFAQGDVKLSERAFRRALELDDSAREPAAREPRYRCDASFPANAQTIKPKLVSGYL